MKMIRFTGPENSLVSFQQEFYESYGKDYAIEVQPDLNPFRTRNICYDKQTNTLLISNVHNGRVHLINLMTGLMRYYDHHQATVRDIKVCNGEILTSSWDGTVRAVDLSTLKQRLILTDRFMGRSPYLTFAPDMRSILGLSYDSDKNTSYPSNRIRRWSLRDGACYRQYGPLGEHRSVTRSGACVIFNGLIFAISDSGNLNVFNLETGKLLKESVVKHDLRSMCLVQAFGIILAGDVDGNVHFYDIGRHCFTGVRTIHQNEVTFMQVLPGSSGTIFSCGFDGCIHIWEIPSFRRINSIQTENYSLWAFRFIGNRLVVCGDGGDILVYEINGVHDIRQRGILQLFKAAYVVHSETSKMIYTNDPSVLKILTKHDRNEVNSKTAESIILSYNDIGVLHELFGTVNSQREMFANSDRVVSFLPGCKS